MLFIRLIYTQPCLYTQKGNIKLLIIVILDNLKGNFHFIFCTFLYQSRYCGGYIAFAICDQEGKLIHRAEKLFWDARCTMAF